MALIIDLKPNEKIIVGNAVITNDEQRTRLHIEGDSPILREKDIMTETMADTPCKKIYLAIQLMYLARNPKELHDAYFELTRDVQNAAPSTLETIMKINDHIMADKYYLALKDAKELIEYEGELLANVS